MNTATQKIKAKGYSLPEFLKVAGFSLSTYRRYEKKSNVNHNMLNRMIYDLRAKKGFEDEIQQLKDRLNEKIQKLPV